MTDGLDSSSLTMKGMVVKRPEDRQNLKLKVVQ